MFITLFSIDEKFGDEVSSKSRKKRITNKIFLMYDFWIFIFSFNLSSNNIFWISLLIMVSLFGSSEDWMQEIRYRILSSNNYLLWLLLNQYIAFLLLLIVYFLLNMGWGCVMNFFILSKISAENVWVVYNWFWLSFMF